MFRRFILAAITIGTLIGWDANASSENSKVIVGALQEATEVKPQLTEFHFSAVVEFTQKNKSAYPNVVIDALTESLSRTHNFSAVEQAQLVFELAELQLKSTSPEMAILTLQSLFPLSQQLPWDVYFQLEYKLAQMYREAGQYYAAVDTATTAYKVAAQNQYHLGRVLSAKRLADTFADIEQWASASHWIQVAKKDSQDWQDGANLVWLFLEKSQWHENKGEMFLATQAAKRAIEAADAHGLASIYFDAQLRLAELYRKQYQINQSEPLLQQLYNKAQTLRDRAQQFFVLHEIVELRLSQLQYEEAQTYFDASERLRRFVYLDSEPAANLNRWMSWQKARLAAGQGRHLSALAALNDIDETLDDSMLTLKAKQLNRLGRADEAHQVYLQLKQDSLSVGLDQQRFRFNYLQAVSAEKIQLQSESLSHLNQQYVGLLSDFEQGKRQKSRLLIALVVLLHLVALTFLWWKYSPKKAWQKLHVDALTDCFNHRFMSFCAENWIQHRQSFSIVLFDLDDFSAINEQLGFSQGDALLRRMSAVIRELLYSDCHLIRVSGDRFAILAPTFTEQQAYVLAQRVRIELNKLGAEIQSMPKDITASFAVVTSDHNHSVEKLLSAAKLALSVAKKQGKNRTEIVYLD